jgi:hypothetical protein
MARDFGGAKKTRKIQTFALLGFDITGACILRLAQAFALVHWWRGPA